MDITISLNPDAIQVPTIERILFIIGNRIINAASVDNRLFSCRKQKAVA